MMFGFGNNGNMIDFSKEIRQVSDAADTKLTSVFVFFLFPDFATPEQGGDTWG
jgi:hypothetical protein